jgi:hypothetical protein
LQIFTFINNLMNYYYVGSRWIPTRVRRCNARLNCSIRPLGRWELILIDTFWDYLIWRRCDIYRQLNTFSTTASTFITASMDQPKSLTVWLLTTNFVYLAMYAHLNWFIMTILKDVFCGFHPFCFWFKLSFVRFCCPTLLPSNKQLYYFHSNSDQPFGWDSLLRLKITWMQLKISQYQTNVLKILSWWSNLGSNIFIMLSDAKKHLMFNYTFRMYSPWHLCQSLFHNIYFHLSLPVP